jgi:hypothetical protein
LESLKEIHIPLGKRRRRREEDIKMGLKEVGLKGRVLDSFGARWYRWLDPVNTIVTLSLIVFNRYDWFAAVLMNY